MNLNNNLERLLPMVEKPGRYIGGERNIIIKDLERVSTRFGFAFPDTYELGMSYLGLQILYKVLNDIEDVYCERLFAPGLDMETELRKAGIPLFTLETKTPAKSLDMLGFTLQYELSYTNVLNMLNLSNIPLRSKDRGLEDPFVLGGGPCAFNPEPIADFFDFFLIGDGEGCLEELCKAHREWKESKMDRNIFLSTISTIAGIYVPEFYEPLYSKDGTIDSFLINDDNAPERVQKNILQDLELAIFPTEPIVPLIEVVHDRSVIEIFRGCSRGCRFCQAGMIYRPVRERSQEKILDLAKQQLASTGHNELSLLSLSTSDYSCFEPLAMELLRLGKDNHVSLSLPSLRLDSFSFEVLNEIQKYKKTGLTFAPEAGTQRLRNVINKSISDEDIYGSMGQAIKLGWNNIKLYFMIGLPSETNEDLDGIVKIAEGIMKLHKDHTAGRKGGRFQLTVSISNFVPKAHTPFQWVAQDSPDLFREKHWYLRDQIKKIRGVLFQYHGAEPSQIEAVLARGDRKLSYAIEKAWEAGSKFDGWREHFNYERWIKALNESGIDPDFYTNGAVANGKMLPWELIDCGISTAYLKEEAEKAANEIQTPDCRIGCTGCGMNRYTECATEGSK